MFDIAVGSWPWEKTQKPNSTQKHRSLEVTKNTSQDHTGSDLKQH